MTNKKNIAMLVMNPCAPDTRVMKEAESLTRSGYCVRVFCLKSRGLPDYEIVNGVEYQRIRLIPGAISGIFTRIYSYFK